MSKVGHLTIEERKAHGKEAAKKTPLLDHGGWAPPPGRPDPVSLLEEQNVRRETDLVPVRHARMMQSPFTFYRGAAKIMASDLSETPTAGLDVQLCGDAHLSNFGVFASPERTMLFGLNDFDETLPGPFEYDLKRLAASFTIAARHNGYSRRDAGAATRTSVNAYREAMGDFAKMRTLEIWYARLSEPELMRVIKDATQATKSGANKAAGKKSAEKQARKARSHDSLRALSKLAEKVDGRYRIASVPPLVVPLRDLAPTVGFTVDEMKRVIKDQFRAYRESLPDDRQQLLERFRVVDMARQGRRRRECRDAGVHRAPPRTRRR